MTGHLAVLVVGMVVPSLTPPVHSECKIGNLEGGLLVVSCGERCSTVAELYRVFRVSVRANIARVVRREAWDLVPQLADLCQEFWVQVSRRSDGFLGAVRQDFYIGRASDRFARQQVMAWIGYERAGRPGSARRWQVRGSRLKRGVFFSEVGSAEWLSEVLPGLDIRSSGRSRSLVEQTFRCVCVREALQACGEHETAEAVLWGS